MDVVGEQRTLPDQTETLVRLEIVARPRKQLGDGGDLGGRFVEVRLHQHVRVLTQQATGGLQHPFATRERKTRRHGVAEPPASVPAAQQGLALGKTGFSVGLEVGPQESVAQDQPAGNP